MTENERTKTLKKCFGTIYRQGQIMDNCKVKHLHITGVQARYLEIISEQPGISQDAIAREESVDKGAVARAIKKLEVEKYVTRRRNKQDSRAWCLYLTQRGEEVCMTGEKRKGQFEEELFRGFTEEEINTLVSLMGRMTHNIEEMKANHRNRKEEEA